MLDPHFSGKRIVITGGGSGIGAAVALKVIEAGGEAILLGRTLDKLKSVSSQAKVFVLDHNDEKSVVAFASKCGDIDGLFLNAGSYVPGTITQSPIDVFDQMIESNLRGHWLMAHYLVPKLVDGSSIVVTGSNIGNRALSLGAPYGVAKAALHMMTKYLAQELGGRQIKVNAIAPGPVATGMILDRISTALDPEDMLDKLKRTNPMLRIGHPEEIAALVLFLLGNNSGWITGSIITVDGGAESSFTSVH